MAATYGIPERRLRDCRDSSYFLRYGKNYTSQGGEDGILEALFGLVGTTTQPYCVEIGAWDGQHLSNTYRLVHGRQWGGLLVEANSERHKLLQALYADRSDVICLDSLVDIEGEHSLLNILNNHSVPRDLDFISIDVDGADYHLWDVIGAEYQARVVCIEFNPTIPNHVHYVQPRDIAVQEGSSLLALVELGRSFGFHIVVTTTFNAIFVRQDLLPLLPEGIFTYLPATGSQASVWTSAATSAGLTTIDRVVDLNSLHNCGMSTDIFQTYSGELKLCGPKKLFWHRVPMNIQQMQAIKSKKDRVFPFAPPYQETITGLDRHLACITPLLATVMTVGTDNRNGASSSVVTGLSVEQLRELSDSLRALLDSCRAIFGLDTGDAQQRRQQGNPLQSIAHETLMNVLAMCLIAHHQLCAAGSGLRTAEATATAQGVSSFLRAVAELYEQLADRVLDAHADLGPASRASLLEEAHRRLERAVYIAAHLRTHAAETPSQAETTAVSRLACKLSSCCLLEGTQSLPWSPQLKAHKPAPEPLVLQCASIEELDCLLRGQFWLLCAAPRAGEAVSADSASTEEVEALRAAVARKWQSKMRWVGSPLPGAAFSLPSTHTARSAPAACDGAEDAARSASVLDLLASPLSMSSSRPGDSGVHSGNVQQLLRNLELEERLKRSARTSAWAMGLSFVAGGCVVAVLGFLVARR